ncbi:MAG: TIGR01906 family membrane protein [Tissierellales bacterium]|nr:TIGR01906 family membrane protein [Tissierellales bacterium]
MKKIDYVLLVILIISISIFALITALENNAYNLDYYMESYSKNNVYEITNKSYDELETISKKIIEVIKGNADANELEPYFNQKEIHHMRDVQGLFNIAKILKLISAILIIILIFYFLKKEKANIMGKWIGLGLAVNYFILLILFILVTTDFNRYFIKFHELFFSNDLWILDPSKDLLIQLMPEAFFTDIIIKILIRFIVYILIAQFIGYIFYKKGLYNIPSFKKTK